MTRWCIVVLILSATVPFRTVSGQIFDDRLQPPGTIAEGPMRLRATERALQRSAQRDAEHGKVSRLALFEMAFPDDSAQFAGLGGNALMAVTALSWCQYELPLKSAYLTTGDERVPLEPVSSIYSAEADSAVAGVYGGHRSDELFLVPVEAVARGGTLMVDFAQPPDQLPQAAARVCSTPGRDAFQLHEFKAGDLPADYLTSMGSLATHAPDIDALVAFVRRQYPEFLTRPSPR